MIKIFNILAVFSFTTLFAVQANADKIQNERKFYIGFDAGTSTPVVNKFKQNDTDFKIKPSHQYSYNLGYKISPDISTELAFSHKPKFKFGMLLASLDGQPSAVAEADAKHYMINFVYNFNNVNTVTPYFLVGAGITNVRLNPTIIKGNTPLGVQEIVRTKHYTSKSFSWQVGLGATKPITDNFKLNIRAAMLVAQGVKLKYEGFDKDQTIANYMSGNPTNAYKSGVIKKTLGVGEILVGFRYDLPF